MNFFEKKLREFKDTHLRSEQPSSSGQSNTANRSRAASGGSSDSSPKAKQKTPQEAMDALPAEYYEKEFDAAAHVYANLPEGLYASELDRHLMEAISEQDIVRDEILKRLSDHVQLRYNEFIDGMKNVQDVSMQLSLAGVNVKNGRRLLHNSRDNLVETHLTLVNRRRRRDRMQQLVVHMRKLQKLFRAEKGMQEALEIGEYPRAVNICMEAKELLEDESMQRIDMLQHLRRSMQSGLARVREQIDDKLAEVSVAFDAVRYDKVIRAYLLVDSNEESSGRRISCVAGMVRGIEQAYVSAVDQISYQTALAVSGCQNSGLTGSKKWKAICESMDGDTTLRCIQETFKAMSELMHSHFLLVQWHRDPFNPQNEQLGYLHREAGVEEGGAEKGMSGGKGGGTGTMGGGEGGEGENYYDYFEQVTMCRRSALPSPTHPHISNTMRAVAPPLPMPPSWHPLALTPPLPASARLHLHQAAISYESREELQKLKGRIVESRKLIWDRMQQSAQNLLKYIDVSREMKLHRFVAVLRLSNKFAKVYRQ
jgi:hypothetical protein